MALMNLVVNVTNYTKMSDDLVLYSGASKEKHPRCVEHPDARPIGGHPVANASYHTQPPQRSQKRPDPARVIQSYYHQVNAGGKRGAYRRTGDLYNISDESVRRYVLAFEAQANVPTLPNELVYTPPPGGYPLPQPVPIAPNTPQHGAQTTPAACGEVTSTPRSNVAETPQDGGATRHTDEHAPDAEDSPELPQSADEDEEEPLLPPPVPQSPLPAPAPPPPREEPQEPPGPIPIWAGVPPVQRIVMRAPVKQHRPSALQWIADHPVARQQLLAWTVFLVLVLLTMVGS